jgi:predicted HTH transcriptional regulator
VKGNESSSVDPSLIRQLTALVSAGESLNLEFKRKAAFPDKIVREMIAFANTAGGTLLIGVDDDGNLQGVRYPDEEGHVIRQALQTYCRPSIEFDEKIISLSAKKSVLRFDIPVSPRRPHYFRVSSRVRETYIRVRDMTMKASDEMTEIVRRNRQKKDIQFTYGIHESMLMRYLDDHPSITLKEFQQLSGLDRFIAARKLVTLVLANVIRITPTEKGDLYSRK